MILGGIYYTNEKTTRYMRVMSKKYTKTLTIAGSDSGGAAGIQADLKTFSALGCYGMSVLTALTAQNTTGVTAIHGVPTEFIAAQIDAVLLDIGSDAVKIGMLHSPEVIALVADRLKHHKVNNIVLDPVMFAKGGDKLLQDDAVEALKSILLPMASVLTPNLAEAETFLERAIVSESDRKQACKSLAQHGAQAVLLKGGGVNTGKPTNHSDDVLYCADDEQFHILPAQRIATKNIHGTGCTLSSAIAAFIAQDYPLVTAIAKAKTYITGAIESGADYQLGDGHGPVRHFYQWW